MSKPSRPNLPQGSNISLFGQKYVVNGQTDAGYELEDQETDSVSILPFLKFVEYHKAAALSVEGSVAMPSSRVELRLQGLKIAEQLSNQQQEFGEFHHAICIAMDALKVHLRRSKCDPYLELSIGIMQKKENRAFIHPIVQGLFGKNVLLGNAKGGFQKQWFLYQGRTLMKYYWIYETLGDDDDAIAGLATLDHLKGNDRPPLLYRLRELMIQAWEELGFDLKWTSVANVQKHLAMGKITSTSTLQRNRLKPSGRFFVDHWRACRVELVSEKRQLWQRL